MSQRTAQAHQWYRDRKDWIGIFESLCQAIQQDKLWLSSAVFEETAAVRLIGKARDEKNVDDFIASLKKTDSFKDFGIKIENRKRNPGDKTGYPVDFTVAVSPVVAQPKRKR